MNHSFLLDSALSLVHSLGYAGLAVGMIVSTLGLFSSEVVLLVGGLAAREGNLNFLVAFVVVLASQLVGGGASYAIGRYGGQPLIARYGRYVLLSKTDLERAEAWFKRYGRAATTVGYCLPLIRGYVGYAAGIAGEDPKLFTVGLLAGSAVWSFLLMAIGYKLADRLPAVERVLQPFSGILGVIVLAALIYFFWHRYKESRA